MSENLLQRAEDWRNALSKASLLSANNALALDTALSEAKAGRLLNPPPPLLTVMLMGATGGGKSELLNALAGAGFKLVPKRDLKAAVEKKEIAAGIEPLVLPGGAIEVRIYADLSRQPSQVAAAKIPVTPGTTPCHE